MPKLRSLFVELALRRHRLLRSRVFRVLIGVLVFVDLAMSILFSFPDTNSYWWIGPTVNYFSALFFTIEYLIRVTDAYSHTGEKRRWWKAKLDYMFSFFGVVDFIAILPFTLPFFFEAESEVVFYIARIFLVFKLTRYSESFRSIIRVFNTVKGELRATFFALGVMICFAALMMYYIESEAQPGAFTDVGQGFWWAVITITSVGYGDIYPVTLLGKVLGASIALLGVLLFAIPTGIVSSAFVDRRKAERQDERCPHCGKKL